ncbi:MULTISPECIES: FAD-dependent oxidoreductase [unclassified Sphingobium]|uniref:FAD-dependent oxidoreductase n=1 Tax=unclassified Sphingobium TaxID=2611147 RepID=UPI0035A6F952
MTTVMVIGAGPAGMSAALELQERGLAVIVLDDQPAPGGRIFAAIEKRELHGREDKSGAELVARFRAVGGEYLSATEVWQIDSGTRVFLTHEGRARMIEPNFVLLATGAQERPMPFSGWQLPGVMTVGAAQILLKTAAQVPDRPVWLAGTGPLLLLYARQLVAAGGAVAGILDTAPRHRRVAALPLIPRALPYGWRDLARGIGWLAAMSRLRVIRNVGSLEALGTDRIEGIRFRTRDGTEREVDTDLLFVHDGVVPAVHTTMAAGCAHRWNSMQQSFEPLLDDFGGSSIPNIFVAGDGATIAGARAATISGRLAAIGIARAAGTMSHMAAETAAIPLRRELAAASGFRRLIDTLYPPSELALSDDTMVCRCEEVSAGKIREALHARPHLGPDGVKIATRAGMGPCQGRQCGLSLARLVQEAHGGSRSDIGFLRVRAPLKPLTLGELASLETNS